MDKWKQLLAEAQAAAKAAQAIAAKGDAMTDADRAEYKTQFDLAVAKKAESEVAKKAADDAQMLSGLAGSVDPAPGAGDDTDRLQITDRQEKSDLGTFGARFVKSGAYEAFRKEFPQGPGKGTPINIGRTKVGERGEWAGARARTKTLTFPQANRQPTRLPTVDKVDRDRLTLLDLIDHGQTDGDFEYLQVTAVTRNAKIVGELDSSSATNLLKPISDLTTQMADAKVYTYADGYDVTNKLLANAPALASYMNNELEYSLDNLIEEKLLNGTGSNGEPRGILTTTGVQEQTYVKAAGAAITDADAMAFIKATRRAITKVTRIQGGTVTAVVLSPEMDEAIDLLQDGQQRFYGQGPFNSGPTTLWGRPRVTSERLNDSQGILGDWKQVALLDAAGLSILVFNQHKDYAQRNLNYVRAELDAAQVIWKPNRLCVVKPAA